MAFKFRKGQQVVCVHYKDKPVVTINEVIKYDQEIWTVWVKDDKGKLWWGPEDWFKPVKR
jgi:hypothetical protein